MSSVFLGILSVLGGIAFAIAPLLGIALINSYFLRFSTKILTQFYPSSGLGIWVSFLGVLAFNIINAIFNFICEITQTELSLAGGALVAVIYFFTYSKIIDSQLKHPERGSLGLFTACFINLFQTTLFGTTSLVLYYLFKIMFN